MGKLYVIIPPHKIHTEVQSKKKTSHSCLTLKKYLSQYLPDNVKPLKKDRRDAIGINAWVTTWITRRREERDQKKTPSKSDNVFLSPDTTRVRVSGYS
jgi:hypothetical protein